ncbi:Cytoskeleton-associated protein 2 [Microtus ochrogaster]|uniref:Cytoskeleton-associated protein 2 n=1 Tax=Microtus ochrogaster TaxID=79684 RepID=A0A8J6KV70_MICOH|nr:Cytoskeleton-associated protein 2 [Microtus ochrogaster]
MAESRKRFPGRSGRNTLPVPRDLQLPPTKRDQPAFREQRKQKLKEYLLIRKTMLPYKQENQISRDQQVMTVEDPVQEGKKVLKLKTEMADKENIDNTVEKNCIPLKADEVTSSEIHNLKDHIQAVQAQTMTSDQACHLKDNKKVQATAEKPKQDANMPKKRVLGYYHGQVVQSKINSFRKLANVKGETPVATKKPPATMSKASKAQSAPGNAVSIRASSVTAASTFVKTKSVSSTSRNTLVRPPVRSLHSNAQGAGKQGPARTLANVTVRKGPLEKDSLRSERVVSVVDTRPQDTKRDKAPSRSIASEGVARTNLSNTRLMEKSKAIDQRRYSVAGAAVHRSVQPRESTEDRKARMTEWRTGKEKGLKRPPNLIANQSEPQGQNKNPTGSFWTTMAEEDEQRVFTEKVNKTISECLNLINKKGCPKEEILDTLNDLISNIPDAKKLVKYWICLVRLEPITSPIENIISIYEKAILAGAQFGSGSGEGGSGTLLPMPSMDDYTVLSVIGQGSFGRALLVRQESSNQKFAMKEVRLPKSFSDTQKSRKEAVLLAKMKHPNIVAFQESFEAEGHLYIVMEYCDGGDLMQKIKQQKGKLLPEDTVRTCSRERELNSHFQKSFGVTLPFCGFSPMAFACTYVGTPYYVPPEIWENLPYNNKSDIWSLGCILYELCALKHPIIREYGEQILDETKLSEPKKPKKEGSPSAPQKNATPGSPHRQQWESHVPGPALAALEKAPILTSSFTAEDDRGGSVIKYSENRARQQWLKEPPETLLSMLKGADLSLAFETYTIYRPGTEGSLKGPLSEETASDSVDGDHESVILDPERFEPRLDEEDTDFEEDDENPDWVSELKKHVGWKDTPDGNPAEPVPEPCGGDTDAWKRGDD